MVSLNTMESKMNLKTIALAAASISVLAIYSTGASAQATRVYNSPAQARTSDASQERAQYRTERAMNRARRIDAYNAAPQGSWNYGYGQPSAFDKHTSEVKDW
jgi:hypothetical protein